LRRVQSSDQWEPVKAPPRPDGDRPRGKPRPQIPVARDLTQVRATRALIVAAAVQALVVALAAARVTSSVSGDRPLGWSDGLGAAALVAASFVVISIGQFVRANQRLASRADEATAREAQLLAVTGEWIWSTDAEMSIVSSNVLVERFLGLAVEDVLGMSFVALLHPGEREAGRARLPPGPAEPSGWSEWRARFIHRNGEMRWLETNAVAIDGVDGQHAGYRGTARDVTDSVLNEEARIAATDAYRQKLARVRYVLEHPAESLHVVFQPIVSGDGTIDGVEALSRFLLEPHRSPDEWFAEAAEVGLAVALEMLAIREALAQLDDLPDGYLAVNVSPATLLALDPTDLCTDRSDLPARLVLELTEHIVIEAYGPLRAAIDELRRSGIRIAVDDAGAGYSSLQHILEIRPDFIKLDRSMVAGIARDPIRRALVSAVTDFSSKIGADVIAEGVEDTADLHVLRAVGVRWVQGYLLARPGPPPMVVRSIPESGLRAVVIDDDPAVRLLVTQIAHRSGVEVIGQASDGSEGLDLAERLEPDLVVLDLSMPVMGGESALPHLRERLPDAYIIVLSGSAESEAGPRLVQAGADAFVEKFDAALRLVDLFERAVERFRGPSA